MSGQDKIWIFDTTLRDGEQALRASLSHKQKIQLAHAIARLNVDVMEVGFPVSSPGDFESVQSIATQVKGPIICGLARAVSADIEACGQALANAERRRIHTFIATSPLHLQYKLRRTLEQATEQAVAAIQLARRYTDDVEFSCEDAGRTPIDDLCRIVEAAIKAGARTINIPDTVGYTIPNEFARIITELRNKVPNIDQAILSVHCHNDLGLAVANSITAVQAGARQIECTVNGIGERAGNCSLEEVAMIIKTRPDVLPFYTDIKSTEIYRSSHLVSQICHMPIQPNKAIVGENAFAHSSGIHQDGVLKAQNTYEIMSPEQVGIRQNELNLTSRSGRAVIQHRLSEMGYTTEDYNLDEIYQAFVTLADQKGRVFDYDLEALVFFQNLQDTNEPYKLEFLSSSTHTGHVASATVGISINGETRTEAATGNGPVEASFQAIQRIVGSDVKMVDFNLQAKGSGEDALGQVDIIAEHQGRRYHGAGLATDIVRSSVLAYVHVLNLIERSKQVDAAKQARRLSESQTEK
ncbi:2-isopropylmalate synthase, bacterial type [Rheinheimera sp. A13L]|uniref:2-isopropylmalate synthase n=1 Tax=Rheinheimera sp. A13L TaxID=506534 RepID=UPI0002124ED2|nr:2-isopropylmalate synthase [Rheinheimera sp. A13L]EGM77522.1 2-isopropylmalate synthase, bacterial type [Rheinheimera sp. A13L]